MGARLLESSRKHASEANGFTLLELIVALTLVGLIAMVLFGGMRLGTRTWDSARSQLGSTSDVQAVQNFLRQHIADARIIQVANASDGSRVVAFDGVADQLAFVGILPSQIAPGGLYRIELEIRRERESPGLVLVWRRITDDDWFHARETGSRFLLEGIQAVGFSYYGVSAGDRDPRWHEQWREATTLPRLVRLHIAFPTGDRRFWPDLTVAVGAAG